MDTDWLCDTVLPFQTQRFNFHVDEKLALSRCTVLRYSEMHSPQVWDKNFRQEGVCVH